MKKNIYAYVCALLMLAQCSPSLCFFNIGSTLRSICPSWMTARRIKIAAGLGVCGSLCFVWWSEYQKRVLRAVTDGDDEGNCASDDYPLACIAVDGTMYGVAHCGFYVDRWLPFLSVHVRLEADGFEKKDVVRAKAVLPSGSVLFRFWKLDGENDIRIRCAYQNAGQSSVLHMDNAALKNKLFSFLQTKEKKQKGKGKLVSK